MSTDFRIERHPIVLLRPRVSFPYAWVGHIPFAFLAVDLLRPRAIVELGTDSGNSYLAFCQAVKRLGLSTRCSAVDSWQGDEHARRYGDEIYEALRARHDPQYGAFSRLLRTRFDDAVAEFADASVDLLHIDGLHTYEAVRHDFETWLPKLSERSVVLLHDTRVREREFGVWKFFEEVSARYPTFDFHHSNGLGVVAVGGDIPPAFLDFLRAATAAPEAYREFFERLAANLIGDDGALPIGEILTDTNAVAHLYFRQQHEVFDDARMVSLPLPDTDGSLDLRFSLPPGVRPDYLRLDPVDLPGMFSLLDASLRCVATDRVWPVNDLPLRVGLIHGDRLQPDEAHAVRIATFGEDPFLEFAVGDLLVDAPAEGPLEATMRVRYEAVIESPSARRLLRQQATALDAIRIAAEQHTDIRVLGQELAAERNDTRQTYVKVGADIERSSVDLSAKIERLASGLHDLGSDASTRHATLHEGLQRLADSLEKLTPLLHAHLPRMQDGLVELHQSLTNVEARLDSSIERLALEGRLHAEQMARIEARLDQISQRSLWSFLKPNRR